MLSSRSFEDRIAVILFLGRRLVDLGACRDPSASRAQSVIVVTGHEPTKVRAALNGLNVTFVHNPDYSDGMAGSLAAGVSALPDHVSGVLIALGDMPKLQITTVNALIETFDDAAGRSICIPIQEGRRGNPVLFGRTHFPSLSVLTGDHGGKSVVRANSTPSLRSSSPTQVSTGLR